MTEAEVFARLRAAGHRLTATRRRLVEVLLRAEGPLTAEEIHRRVAESGADLSTVYRNLGAFCELGWLAVLPGTNGERRYQAHDGRSSTLSVLCLDCGEVTPVAGAAPGAYAEAVRGLGFAAEGLRVTVAAHCGHVCPHRPAEK